MRRRILVLLQAHPEGLTPVEMRTLLAVFALKTAWPCPPAPQPPTGR